MDLKRERPIVADLVSTISIPRMFKVRQCFDRTHILVDEIPNLVLSLLSQEKFAEKIKPGMRIAITAGSRGIANIALIVKTIADFVKFKGAYPFIVPAMGSHGGATAEGQMEILKSYGIVEEYVGCPIISSMEVTYVGKNDEGINVYIDKHAAEADGIIVSCRIKPHTAFRGPFESGIMKMMAIGLGKQYGASVCHAAGFKYMAKNIPLFGRAILKHAPILFALATLENAFDETRKIIAVDTDEIEEVEPILLKEAFSYMPRILIDECDILIVDEIGKNFSGAGMDPNVTGTFATPYASGGIRSQRVCVLDLSAETHGNGVGIGYADVTTARVLKKLDLATMYPNVITTTVLKGANIPIVMESDREAIQLCIKACNEIDMNNIKIVRIPNSLNIEEIMLSEAYYAQAQQRKDLVVEGFPQYLPFDENGNLW